MSQTNPARCLCYKCTFYLLITHQICAIVQEPAVTGTVFSSNNVEWDFIACLLPQSKL